MSVLFPWMVRLGTPSVQQILTFPPLLMLVRNPLPMLMEPERPVMTIGLILKMVLRPSICRFKGLESPWDFIVAPAWAVLIVEAGPVQESCMASRTLREMAMPLLYRVLPVSTWALNLLVILPLVRVT